MLSVLLPIETPPATPHRPIMLREVMNCLRPRPGDLAVDCTLGGGGHASAILRAIQPNGRLVGLDVDVLELARTEARLREAGFGADVFIARAANFADLPRVIDDLGARPDLVLVDLGVSMMQSADPARGFNYKQPGPLDMRMDVSRGEPASALIARLSESDLAALLTSNADEPHAALIAALLRRQPVATTQALERLVRLGVSAAHPELSKAAVKMSVRRTFQALRIAVNDELTKLERLLAALPDCLAPGGRAAILTFHSGEDRRVKRAFRDGRRAGVYAAINDRVIRSSQAETYADRRAKAAKLRWAVRAV